jgi:acetyl-CoA carboxylase carboxyl transferase subunit beta
MGSVDTETEIKCPKCKKMINRDRAAKNKYVCYECGYYFRVKTHNRIRMVADRKSFQPWFEEIEESNPLKYEGYEEKLSEAREKSGVKEAVTVGEYRIRMVADRKSFQPWFEEIEESNPLKYEGYEEKLSEAREKSGVKEAVTVGECEIYGEKAVIGICESKFMMGSMGHVVGEKVTQAIEKATELRLPVFLFCCSGGARMQEGIVSLMQMAKTSAAIKRHGEAGLLYATILTDPTTGGVTASFAMLGDVIMAEPGALIGFAGPRVIKQTLGQRLPDGFQTAEFLQEHGFVDGIVRRENLKKTLYFLITTHRCSEGNYADFKKNFDFHFEPTEIVKERSFLTLPRTAWEKVKTVRRVDRPAATDYIPYIFDYVVEAHGDRYYGDDKALVGAVAFLDGQPMTVLADVKGKDFAECARRNYGMPMPEGYRKALRLMKQAEKFNRPIISFVNTPGAFCGVEAEERGQGEAIARNLLEMSALKVPVLCILIGEGGSGGALATAVGNEVWMMENATYSILSPEGFASILWKDADRAREASEVMNITSEDLKRLGVIERIVPEYGGADQSTVEAIGGYLKEHIKEFLQKYTGMTGEQIAEERYERFRKY